MANDTEIYPNLSWKAEKVKLKRINSEKRKRKTESTDIQVGTIARKRLKIIQSLNQRGTSQRNGQTLVLMKNLARLIASEIWERR